MKDRRSNLMERDINAAIAVPVSSTLILKEMTYEQRKTPTVADKTRSKLHDALETCGTIFLRKLSKIQEFPLAILHPLWLGKPTADARAKRKRRMGKGNHRRAYTCFSDNLFRSIFRLGDRMVVGLKKPIISTVWPVVIAYQRGQSPSPFYQKETIYA